MKEKARIPLFQDAIVLTFGEMQINTGQMQIFQNGTVTSLTTREFDILYTSLYEQQDELKEQKCKIEKSLER